MKEKEYLYKLSHYYSINDATSAVFVKASIGTKEMVHTLGALNFKFEELVDDSECIDERHIVRILEKFYPVEDMTEQCQVYLPYTELDKAKWEMVNVFKFDEGGTPVEVIHIDLYEAREFCCGAGYKELMKTYLPSTKQFEDEMMNLADDYPHLIC